MKMYISKYALSGGIKEVWAEKSDMRSTHVFIPESSTVYMLYKEIHNTRAEAVSAAETLRAKKIASIKKQLAKLEKMEF